MLGDLKRETAMGWEREAEEEDCVNVIARGRGCEAAEAARLRTTTTDPLCTCFFLLLDPLLLLIVSLSARNQLISPS